MLPEAPVRHWICFFLLGLRGLLGYDKQLCAEVLEAVIKKNAVQWVNALAVSAARQYGEVAPRVVQRIRCVRLTFQRSG